MMFTALSDSEAPRMWHNADAPASDRSGAMRRRHRVKTRSGGTFRQWPMGLLVEVATLLALIGAASLVALLAAGMA